MWKRFYCRFRFHFVFQILVAIPFSELEAVNRFHIPNYNIPSPHWLASSTINCSFLGKGLRNSYAGASSAYSRSPEMKTSFRRSVIMEDNESYHDGQFDRGQSHRSLFYVWLNGVNAESSKERLFLLSIWKLSVSVGYSFQLLPQISLYVLT